MTATVTPLVGKQRRSVELATARLNIWEGSVRSSKTVCSLLRWLLYVRQGPPGNLVMIGKTERTLKRNIIDPLVEMIGQKRCRAKWGDGELMLLGRRIYLAGANDAKAEDKIRGLTLAGAYVDEVSLLPHGFWSMLLTRLSVEGAQLFGTTNPDNPQHWLMRDVLKKARTWLRHDGRLVRSDAPGRLDLARFSFRLADNPTLSAAYLAALAAEFQGLYRLRFIEGLWVLAEGAIFDTLDVEPGGAHVVADVPRSANGAPLAREWVLAIDYGTANPFVALLIGLFDDVDEKGQPFERMYVAREWRWDSRAEHGQKTDAQYSKALGTWLDGLAPELGRVELDRIIVDPSAASFIAQLWADGWHGVRGADNSVTDGIRSTATLLAADRLRIHESCATEHRAARASENDLLGELAGYVWDPTAAAKGEERPVKDADHGPDALRYGVMGTRLWWRHWLTIDPTAAGDGMAEAA